MLVKEITQRITFHGFDLKPGFFWGKLQNGTEFVITSVFVPGCVEEERPEEASARVFIRAKSGDWEETEWYASSWQEEEGALVLDIAIYLCQRSPRKSAYLPNSFKRLFAKNKRQKRIERRDIRRSKCKGFWLVSAEGHEQNSFADENTCHDGGGYFQPAGTAVFRTADGVEITVHMNDWSCGDIGIRKTFSVSTDHSWELVESTMDGWHSSSAEEYDTAYLEIKNETGVNVYHLLYQAEQEIRNAAYSRK